MISFSKGNVGHLRPPSISHMPSIILALVLKALIASLEAAECAEEINDSYPALSLDRRVAYEG